MSSQIMKRWVSLFTFELPLSYNYIYLSFCQTHEKRCDRYSYWPAASTRGQLIAGYWRNVLAHYLSIIALGVLATSLFNGALTPAYFFTIAMLTMMAYLPLHLFIYKPFFNTDFLPNLEAAIAAYEGKQRAWLEKCKQDQLSNRALVLLFYVFDKTSNLSYLTPSDKSADLLHKIFGVSPKGMKNELDLIFKKSKRPRQGQRHMVEVAKSFEEAYQVLEAMQFTEGIKVLKALEQQFL